MFNNIRKPFCQKLCDKYDEPARNFVKKFYNDLGIKAIDNHDKYGVDLILLRDNIKVGYAEVEVCVGWNSPMYPFKTYHVPLRKGKFFNLDMPTEFWAVSNTFSRALHIDGNVILESPQVIVPNKYVLSNERFYEIELNLMQRYNKGLLISLEEVKLDCLMPQY
tara:strand:- start:560 stop:1051 length:492 start_codon:yes stop_codon:yes gene_type:complete